jgi:hypothetical protein
LNIMNITQIPGALVRRGLQAARLPLTLMEVLRRRDGDSRPALAFDAIGATVKSTVGSLVRDHALAEEGRLERARVAELGRAQQLEDEAAQRRAAADAKLDSRLAEDERRREQMEREASEELEAAALERDRKERQAKQEAAKKADAAERAQAAAERAVEKRERAARSEKLAAERKAVQSARKAVGAKKAVKRVDKKLKNTQEARRA